LPESPISSCRPPQLSRMPTVRFPFRLRLVRRSCRGFRRDLDKWPAGGHEDNITGHRVVRHLRTPHQWQRRLRVTRTPALAPISAANDSTNAKPRREAAAKNVRKSIISGPNPKVLMCGIRFALWSPILKAPDSCRRVGGGLVRPTALGEGIA
jgi:hypothetical protein